MRVPFSPKLRLALLWPALAALSVVGLVLGLRLPEQLSRNAAEELLHTSLLVEGALLPLLEGEPAEWSQRLAQWARGSRLRVTVVDPTGRVLAESVTPVGGVAAMENHRDRPEIAAALRRGSGTAVRRSDTTGDRYAYAARLLQRPGGDVLVVRLAQPIAALSGMRRQMVGTLALAALAASGVIFAVWWWLRGRLFRPLAELIDGANALARGPVGQRLPVPAEDELATLALAVNRLADRVEEQLAAAEGERDHLQEVLASLPDGVLVVSAEGRAVTANPAFRRFFGLRDEPVTGKAPLELVRLPRLAEMVRDTAGQRPERPGPSENTVEIDSPERRTLLLSSSSLRHRGGGIVVARDVTNVARLDEMRRDFVANVSHELKTPLAAIRGYAETLRDGAIEDRETAPRFIDRILHQSRRLQALLEDLLTLSRLESVGVAVEGQPVDLVALVRRALETIGSLEREKGVAATLEVLDERGRQVELPPRTSGVGGPLGLTVHGDPEALERMVSNLLENAVKYNRPGGHVVARLRPEPAPGAPAAPPSWVSIEVSDTGIGIPTESLPRIFERFYRADKARSREEGGTGLGLAIVKHVAQGHGGKVEVESVHGQGSTFRVRLPRGGSDT